MYQNTHWERRISLFVMAVLIATNLLSPSSHAAAPIPGNGIFVGQTKLYDERSLALMYYSLQAKLANRDFFDQGNVAAAIGKFQGARLDASSFGLNLTTTPIPGITTESNIGGTTEATGKATQAAVAAGTTPGTPGIETTTKVTTSDGVKETVTRPAVTPAAAALPPQTSAFAFQPPFGLAPQTLLAQQIELTHALDNVRLMVEGSLTDRIITAPITGGGQPGATFSGPRMRAVVGFDINLESPKQYENAVADVEITITSQGPSAGRAPSIVTVLPRENNYNVATVTKDAKQFGFGVAVQPINLGLSAQTQKETLYLVQDLDTVSFERPQPHDAASPPPGSITFGWQFRPVLGQKVVKAGPRQVFAVLALPTIDFGTFVGKVEARTFWRKYDSKKKTVGDFIKGSESYRVLDDLNVLGKLSLDSELLQPEAAALDWMDVGQGNILVTSRGSFYLPGMGIILGGQFIGAPENGFLLQSDASFRWLVSGQRLALVDDALVAGRFGPPAKLRDPIARTDTGARNLTITRVDTSALDSQNSKVRVALFCTAAADFTPVIVFAGKAYGFSDAPLVKVVNVPVAGGGRNMVVELVAPTQSLLDSSKLVARLLFFGRDYTDEKLATSFVPPGRSAFMTTKVIVLTSGDPGLFGITGSGFGLTTVRVNVGGVTLSPGSAAGIPGPPGSNNAVLTFNDPTLLTLSMPATLAKTVKQISLIQGGAPILLPVSTPTPPPPKPKIYAIDTVNVGDQGYVKVTGENLGSVDKAVFQGAVLKTKNVSDDGKTMDLLVTKDMSDKKGRRSIDFLSKDGTTEVSGDLIVNP